MKKPILLACILTFFSFNNSAYSQILTVTPDTVTQGQSLDIEVTAENIDFTQGTNIVNLKQGGFEEYVSSTTNSPTQITINHTFNTDNPIGSYDLSIMNTNSGTSYTKNDALYVRPDLTVASLDSISIASAKQGDNITFVIYGSNTNFDLVANSVYLMNSSKRINATNSTAVDSRSLEVRFDFDYSHPIGLYSIYVENTLDGTQSISNVFELQEGTEVPGIISIIPDTLVQGISLDIEVTAENIDFTQGTNTVKIKQASFEEYIPSTTNSSTQITINHTFNTDYSIGNYDLYILNSGSGITLSQHNALYVKPDLTIATLDSISAESAKQGDNISFIIYGTNTNFNLAYNSVYLQQSYTKINAASITELDSETLEVEFDFTYAHPTGLYSMYVKNDLDGTQSISNVFELQEGIALPGILSITPDTITLGQTLDIEVTAENIDFTQGTNVVKIQQGSFEKYPSYTANSPGLLTLNHSFDTNYPTGNYDLYILNTGSGITLFEENALYLKAAMTSIDNDHLASKILIYPNPASKQLYIKGQYNNLEIFDIKGKKVLEARKEDLIDISNLTSGIYLIRIKVQEKIISQKLLIE